MNESELTEVFRRNNKIYCVRKSYRALSIEAQEAHEKVKELIKQNYTLINIETMSLQEMKSFLEEINSDIASAELLVGFNVSVLVKESDLYAMFNADGSTNVHNLKVGTNEIFDLLKDPSCVDNLHTIKRAMYIPRTEGDKEEEGYIIPMTSYGDFFEICEASSLCRISSFEKTADGFACQYMLDPEKERSLYASYEAARAKEATEEDKKSYQAKAEGLYAAYCNIFHLIEELKKQKQIFTKIAEKNLPKR